MDSLRLAADTIRILAADAVQKANQDTRNAHGHGRRRGRALDRVSEAQPRKYPRWPDRDRLLLSAGHGSMLLYSLLHLTGYDMPLAEPQRFRQWDSKTPGHPEYGVTPGA